MTVRCRLGLHRWMSHTTSEIKGGNVIVYSWGFCERAGCRYSGHTLLAVETIKSKPKPYDQERW
jgi:hypothetical protein